jgi:hypothetical protein
VLLLRPTDGYGFQKKQRVLLLRPTDGAGFQKSIYLPVTGVVSIKNKIGI